MRFPIAQFAVVTLACCVVASPAASQNLVVNGGFTSGIASWNAGAGGSFTHDPALDANGNPASGSGSAVNPSPVAFGSYTVSQCVDGIVAGESYDFGGEMYFDSANQSATGRANVILNFRDGASCAGSTIGGETTSNVLATTTDVWVAREVLGTIAPGGAQSVYVNLFVNKFDSTGQIETHFDAVFLRATPVSNVPSLSAAGLTVLVIGLAVTALAWTRRRTDA